MGKVKISTFQIPTGVTCKLSLLKKIDFSGVGFKSLRELHVNDEPRTDQNEAYQSFKSLRELHVNRMVQL